ncbi:peptidase [Candidatus Bathyarchaeota archaeon]|nr:MAG: peptidase [Candidatus Bathyarchaeota archaeon]
MKVKIKESLLKVVLENASLMHPREILFMLRGEKKGDTIHISDLIIPPLATYGHGFATFSLSALPIDFSIVGTAHSHPSGNIKPSIGDLNQAIGKIIMIVGFPYTSRNVAVYDREGNRVELEVC